MLLIFADPESESQLESENNVGTLMASTASSMTSSSSSEMPDLSQSSKTTSRDTSNENSLLDTAASHSSMSESHDISNIHSSSGKMSSQSSMSERHDTSNGQSLSETATSQSSMPERHDTSNNEHSSSEAPMSQSGMPESHDTSNGQSSIEKPSSASSSASAFIESYARSSHKEKSETKQDESSSSHKSEQSKVDTTSDSFKGGENSGNAFVESSLSSSGREASQLKTESSLPNGVPKSTSDKSQQQHSADSSSSNFLNTYAKHSDKEGSVTTSESFQESEASPPADTHKSRHNSSSVFINTHLQSSDKKTHKIKSERTKPLEEIGGPPSNTHDESGLGSLYEKPSVEETPITEHSQEEPSSEINYNAVPGAAENQAPPHDSEDSSDVEPETPVSTSQSSEIRQDQKAQKVSQHENAQAFDVEVATNASRLESFENHGDQKPQKVSQQENTPTVSEKKHDDEIHGISVNAVPGAAENQNRSTSNLEVPVVVETDSLPNLESADKASYEHKPSITHAESPSVTITENTQEWHPNNVGSNTSTDTSEHHEKSFDLEIPSVVEPSELKPKTDNYHEEKYHVSYEKTHPVNEYTATQSRPNQSIVKPEDTKGFDFEHEPQHLHVVSLPSLEHPSGVPKPSASYEQDYRVFTGETHLPNESTKTESTPVQGSHSDIKPSPVKDKDRDYEYRHPEVETVASRQDKSSKSRQNLDHEKGHMVAQEETHSSRQSFESKSNQNSQSILKPDYSKSLDFEHESRHPDAESSSSREHPSYNPKPDASYEQDHGVSTDETHSSSESPAMQSFHGSMKPKGNDRDYKYRNPEAETTTSHEDLSSMTVSHNGQRSDSEQRMQSVEHNYRQQGKIPNSSYQETMHKEGSDSGQPSEYMGHNNEEHSKSTDSSNETPSNGDMTSSESSHRKSKSEGNSAHAFIASHIQTFKSSKSNDVEPTDIGFHAPKTYEANAYEQPNASKQQNANEEPNANEQQNAYNQHNVNEQKRLPFAKQQLSSEKSKKKKKGFFAYEPPSVEETTPVIESTPRNDDLSSSHASVEVNHGSSVEFKPNHIFGSIDYGPPGGLVSKPAQVTAFSYEPPAVQEAPQSDSSLREESSSSPVVDVPINSSVSLDSPSSLIKGLEDQDNQVPQYVGAGPVSNVTVEQPNPNSDGPSATPTPPSSVDPTTSIFVTTSSAPGRSGDDIEPTGSPIPVGFVSDPVSNQINQGKVFGKLIKTDFVS